jgi:hypothetical protein
MNRSILAGVAGISLALAATATATAAPVTLRVEGSSGTLVKAASVDPAGVGTLVRDGANCAGTDTAAGALELATAGDWDGSDFGFGVSVDRIRTVTNDFASGRYWELFVNGVSASVGACDQAVQAGDEVVFATACGAADATDCFTGGFLDVKAAPTAKPGEPLTVTATQTTSGYQVPTETTPAGGATIAGGGQTATAGADGTAAITLTQRGAVELRVTRERQVPDTVAVCVTDGADGFCGTRRPDGTTLPPEIGGAPVTPAAPDVDAPVAKVTGIRNGQRFARAKAPRRLTADVADASGVLQVKLSLTRQVGKRCWAFSGKQERFKRVRCGTHPVFKLDSTGAVDYLLPKRLGKGRYVLDVRATDREYNRDGLARGRNRVVFAVR